MQGLRSIFNVLVNLFHKSINTIDSIWFKNIYFKSVYTTQYIYNHPNIRIRTEARAYQVLLLYNILTKCRGK